MGFAASRSDSNIWRKSSQCNFNVVHESRGILWVGSGGWADEEFHSWTPFQGKASFSFWLIAICAISIAALCLA